MNHITSRVHYGDVFTLEAIKKFYDDLVDIDRYVICRENAIKGEREHIHIYMETLLTRKQIADKFSYKFKQLKGNKHKSFKDATKGDGTIKHAKQYTCKGVDGAHAKSPPDIIGKKNIKDKKIMKWHNNYWNDREAYEKEKKQIRKGLIGTIIRDTSMKNTDSEHTIISKIIKWYLDKDRVLPSRHRLADMANTITLKISDNQEKLIREYAERVTYHL